jgi:hypothetical protein
MLEFESILQFCFCPFAGGDIRDDAENRLFTIKINELGLMWRLKLDLIKSTDSGAIRAIKSKSGA